LELDGASEQIFSVESAAEVGDDGVLLVDEEILVDEKRKLSLIDAESSECLSDGRRKCGFLGGVKVETYLVKGLFHKGEQFADDLELAPTAVVDQDGGQFTATLNHITFRSHH
jgi:hypothetical protein